MLDRKKAAYQAFKSGDPDKGLTLVSEILNEHPDDVTSLFMAGEILASAHRYGLAGPIFRRVLDLDPEMFEAWHNLGHCLHVHGDIPGAVDCFSKALWLGGEDFHVLSNLLLMNTVGGDHENAIRLLKRAYFHANTPAEIAIAESGVALAYLSLGQWQEGWRCFESMLGTMKQRKRLSYGEDVPDWDGKPLPPGKTLAVYGEQGIGDEIMFASILPDLLKDVPNITIECEKRLTGLFSRSFDVPVFGTRLIKTDDDSERNWRKDFDFGARVAMGSLAQFYRPTSEAFPRAPYVTADPKRREWLRKRFAGAPGRKIGLAWTGGLPSSRGRERTITPDILKPLIDRNPDCTFISLEYKGHAPEDARILHWPEILQSQDYDDTAALVAELDAVVCVTTTVALLCGALGKECHVLVPESCTWHWAKQAWFGEHVRLYRRKGVDWSSAIDEVACQFGQRLAAQ